MRAGGDHSTSAVAHMRGSSMYSAVAAPRPPPPSGPREACGASASGAVAVTRPAVVYSDCHSRLRTPTTGYMPAWSQVD